MSSAVGRTVMPGSGDLQGWTPARIFLAIVAVSHLVLGVAGFLVDHTFPIGSHAAATEGSGEIFGIFQTNGWHTSAALLLGLIALYFTVRPARARTVALLLGVLHIGITTSFFLWEPHTFWFASNNADQFIHSFTAIAGTASALLTPRDAELELSARAAARG